MAEATKTAGREVTRSWQELQRSVSTVIPEHPGKIVFPAELGSAMFHTGTSGGAGLASAGLLGRPSLEANLHRSF